MSLRSWCPGCDSETSRIHGAFSRGDDCPTCGLPAQAAQDLVAAKARGADAQLVETTAAAVIRASAAEAELSRLRMFVRKARQALDNADAPGVREVGWGG